MAKDVIAVGTGVALFFMSGAFFLNLYLQSSFVSFAWPSFLEGLLLGIGFGILGSVLLFARRISGISADVWALRRLFLRATAYPSGEREGSEGRKREPLSDLLLRLDPVLAPLAAELGRVREHVRELRREERRLREILHEMRTAVFLFDDRGSLRFVNRAAAPLVARPLEDLLGRPYGEVLRNFDLVELVEGVYRTGRENEREFHVYYPEERIVRAHVVPLGAEGEGTRSGVLLAATDVTEVRRLERVRSEFVQNVSHELKTPVTAIRGFAETLLDGALGDPEVARPFLEIILRESERLERLISDILDLSRIERMPRLSLARVRLVEVFHDAYVQLESRFVQKGLRFENRIPEDFVVEADPDRLRQIVLNLMANAVQYNRERGYVAVEAWEDDRFTYFAVEDSGIGIPARDLGRIFERFYRVDKARSRESGGTGLGLAIVKHLVEAHRGVISVVSEEGQGTVFTVALPRGGFSDEEVPSGEVQEHGAPSSGDSRPSS